MLPHLSADGDGRRLIRLVQLLAINYGFDRIRFTGPVLIGSRVRLAFKLVDVTARERGRYLVQIREHRRSRRSRQPALVAEWMFLLVYRD